MPVLNGKVHRARYTKLKLGELSGVDNPAQPSALAAIMKRHDAGKAFDPNQPRDPKGSSTGGRWTSWGVGGSDRDADNAGRDGRSASGRMLGQGDEVVIDPRYVREGDQPFGYVDTTHPQNVTLEDGRIFSLSDVEHVDDAPAEWTTGRFKDGETFKAAVFINRVAKYICEDSGAHTFSEVLRNNEFSQKIWPYADALSQSIRSIIGDTSLKGDAREEKINSSVQQFLSAVRQISPEVSKRLEELVVTKKEDHMSKTVEELQREVEKLTGDLTSANALATAEKARAEKAEAALKTEQDAHAETKKSLVEATDEVIKVGDTEVKKSVVGEAQFSVTKALSEERDLANLEKRAATDLPLVVGTDTEKALALRHVEKLDADAPARKALEAIIQSAQKMAVAGFESLGTSGGLTETQKAAKDQFEDKVGEIQKRDNCSRTNAMSKARKEHPELFATYQGLDAPAAN